MSGKVERHFKVVGGIDQPPPPNEVCVQHLEEALELAKAGVLQSVMVIGMSHSNVMINGWSDWPSIFTALGALVQTQTDYQNREIAQHRPEYTDGMY